MKTKNKRELEKYWAEQAAKKAKLARKKATAAPKAKPADADTGKTPSGSQSAN